MACIRASKCLRTKDIELVRGREVVCSYCDEWRKECLDRHYSALMVMSLRGSSERTRWLDTYEKEYGSLARVRLENEVAYRRTNPEYSRV